MTYSPRARRSSRSAGFRASGKARTPEAWARLEKQRGSSARAYFVYVVELAPRPGESPKRKPDVYVGSSAFPPSVKLQLHHVSAKGSRHVRKRGVRLLPAFFAGIAPLKTRAEAQRIERALSRKLRASGYHVYGACSQNEEKACWL